MLYTRRDVGRFALAAGFASTKMFGAAKPDSKIKGVQIGTITYSYGSMPDQSAEATLGYVVDSGISAIELMGGPVNDWARKKGKWDSSPAAAAAAAANAGRGGRGGGFGRGGRGPAPTYPVVAGMKVGFGNNQPAGQWNGVACPAGGEGRGGPGGARGGSGRGPGGGGFGRGPQTPEQVAAADAERKWRLALSMDIFKDLRKLYNDAGVSIYAVKDVRQDSDEDLDYTFTVARTLGATHVTLELPTGPNADAEMKKLGDWALKYKMLAAYHTHQQGSMTALNDCFEVSKGNAANVDLGHFMAASNPGGSPLDFLNKFHDRIASFHLKDRTSVAHCALNLPWGTGETPIAEILQTVHRNKWTMPATIELEYAIPEGSNAPKEVAKCLEFCRKALA
ncbi:MAG TPA: sugar phosphate isomerase/epimerase [Bryobacteraceae bacterium]|nr:sugar phosphate isomerase/epimerase [Bryobacteraceae bacterium]